ncbi:MAG: malate dehydrogenase [Planctomycetes bacterium]|nr:malate dehydrogenase [Planctomycetota bacterium]
MKRTKISVVGSGFVGATAAQRLLEADLGDLVLYDVIEGKPQGIALDLAESGPVQGFSVSAKGTNDPRDTHGSDLVLVTAGVPRKPGMSRSDLLEVNGKIVRDVATHLREGSRDAIVVVVTNPLDVMTYLLRALTGFPAERVVGMAGVLDSARFRTFLAWEAGVSPRDVDAMVLGGHGDAMVPLLRYATVNGIQVERLIPKDRLDKLVQRTRDGGAEIVNLLKTGSAYYAPSAASVEMIRSILRDEKRLLPCCAHLAGQYGIRDLYVGVPVVLGRAGVERVIELDLAAEEKAALQKSASDVQKDLDLLREKGLLPR